MTQQAHVGAGSARRSIVVADDEAGYAALVRTLRPGGSAVPVMRRPGGHAFDEPPSDAADAAVGWSGVVAVVSATHGVVGECLARATGRTVRRMTLADAMRHSLDEPTTVVGSTATVTPAVLAAVPRAARLGFLVADDLVTSTEIVARNLVWGPVLASHVDVAFDTLASDDDPLVLSGLGLTPAALRTAIGSGVGVLTGRGHGRNCVLHLNNGGICGRADEKPVLADPPPLTDSWSPKPTACQQDGRCWRSDVAMERHLRAATIRAAVAVLDSCGTATAADSAVRTDVSIPLNMLAGRSLAAVCGVGVRAGSPHIGRLFGALVRSGLPLGDALRESNLSIGADVSGMGMLALFGDAGLGLLPRAAVGPDPVEIGGNGTLTVRPQQLLLAHGDELIATRSDGPLLFPASAGTWVLGRHSGGDVAVAPARIDVTWRHRVRPWLARLRAVGGMGLAVDHQAVDAAQRAATGAVIARAAASHLSAAVRAVEEFDRALADLALVQEQLVANEVEVTSHRFQNFLGMWPTPWFTDTHPDPEVCPQCGQCSVTRHGMRSAGGASEPLVLLSCARCAEVMSGASTSPVEVVITHPPEVHAGTGFTVAATVTNTAGHPVAVSVGASFVNEDVKRCWMAAHRASVIAEGDSVTFDFPAHSEAGTHPDMRQIRMFVAADGAFRCHSRYVWLRA